ncbi:hypothetical protein PMIN01_06830 [Paraphaeosphaeria minitans]|uniref:Uncharacterized protein n=1 Tax=Paraphaeosphaeria minitans TaxID=565426 RepID=A0A9P6GJA5_9PLEO|nr:hypothetical protein PMIN01_06830 [Paraphaeosphaeria minitans]
MATITPAHLAALKETCAAASSLVPPALRPDFVFVGSGAMVCHGSRRRPGDIDVVGTPAALWAFLEEARKEGRFSVVLDGCDYTYLVPIPSCISCHANCISN